MSNQATSTFSNLDQRPGKHSDRVVLLVIREAWRRLLIVSTLAFLIAYFALPNLFSIGWVQISLKRAPALPAMMIVSAVLVALLVAGFQGARSIWKRYRHNYAHRVAIFTYLDAIVAAFAAVVLCITLFPDHIFAGETISSTSMHWLAYMGVIVVFWTGLVMYFPEVHRSVPPRGRGVPKTYFGDDPIVSDDEDLLGRTEFVTDVYDRIAKYDLSESHVFGLYGAWGEGKTSALNLLKNRFRNNPNIILVEFDPWYFPSNEAIVRGFFEALLIAINQSFFFPDLKRALTKYGNVLASGVSKVLGVDVRFGPRDESVAELRERIQQCIQRTGKRLIILIDDVDRLQHSADMFMILRLVKLAGNFENTIFVLSFDPQIVAEAVNQTKDKDFLEKIVQSPIDLPAAEQTRINELFCVDAPGRTPHLSRLAEELELTSSQREALRYGFVEHYIDWSNQLFRTLRDVKRFLNGVYTRLPRIKNEVNIGDFLILECVRLFFPRVFRDIHDNHEFYITSIRTLYVGPQQISERIKRHIEALLKDEPRGGLALQALKILFPRVATAFGAGDIHSNGDILREEQRIADSEVFQKYFTLSVPGHQLSDDEVRTAIAGWKETEPEAREARMLKDLSALAQNGTLPQMLEKLRVFLRKENADVQIALAQMLFRHIKQFRDKDDSRSPSSPYHRMRLMIFQLINNAAEEGAMRSLLTQVIDESPSFHVAASTVFFTGNRGVDLQYYRITQYANQKDLSTALATRLKKDLSEEGKDIFHEEGDLATFVLTRWGECDRASMNDYVFSLLERVPGYIAQIFEPYRAHVGGPTGGHFDYPGLIAMYDEKRLYDCAKNASAMSALTNQEREAVQAFIRSHDELKQAATTARQREVNRARFGGLHSEAFQLFEKGQYREALTRYDEAVQISEWDDPHGWVSQLRYQRWRCLLEVALNDGQPIREYFDRAAQESPSEHALKGLIEAAFRNGPPARAQTEFYNCLFYYLQWFFAREDNARTTIKKSLDDHAILAESDQQSTSAPFLERLAQLKLLMSKG